MRSVRSDDYWRHIKSTRNNSYVKSIDLEGYNQINRIEFSNRINIICGLNGAGKTTVLSAIKSIIGCSITSQDKKKLENATVKGEILIDNTVYQCENSENKRLSDVHDINNVLVIEFFQILKILDLLWNLDNIDELLEQSEIAEIKDTQLDEVKYLVGKHYSKLTVCEIEEIAEFEAVPFFTVTIEDVTYNSLNMGMGEYCLFYIYWSLMKMEDNSIVLLEEPESFVGIKSQSSLMNIIAKYACKKRSSFIISTHSPFILERVQDCDIKILSRAGGLTSVTTPESNGAVQILGGKEDEKIIYLVEDSVAKMFLEIILQHNNPFLLRNSEIIIAGSESDISKVMNAQIWKYSLECKYIGIYDDDQQERIRKGDYKFAVCLPPQKDVETAMKKLCNQRDNLKKLASLLGKDIESIVTIFSQVEGEDHHDWLQDISKLLSLNSHLLLDRFYSIWVENNSELVQDFIEKIEEISEINDISQVK